MKHEVKIVGLLLGMFLLTQLIGLVIIDSYIPQNVTKVLDNGTIVTEFQNFSIPYDLEPPQVEPQVSFASIALSFVIAIIIFIVLTKLRADTVIRVWFTFVVFITLAVSLTALLAKFLPEMALSVDKIALILAIPLTFYKVYKRNIIVHNATELLIYPGLATLFVPILRPWSIVSLLLIISVYDMWAVWRSSFMVNLAKYQIKNIKIFTGFYIPYLPKKEAEKLEKMKFQVVKGKSANKMQKKTNHTVKVSLALLGGGDVAFPLIFAGVILRYGGGLVPALFVVAGATAGLLYLFIYSRKGKFYPAMPFITAGALAAWLISFLF